MTMTIFYVIFILYTAAIIWGTIQYDHIRYRLLFGYLLGLFLGAMSLLLTTLDIAIIISVFSGFISNAKMMWSPNR